MNIKNLLSIVLSAAVLSICAGSCASAEPDPVHVTSVSLSQPALTLPVGAPSILTATVLPDNAADKSVTWSSSNPAVASVSSNGIVTALSAGTAVVTVKTNDGGKTATCIVSVTSPDVHVTGVSITPASLTLTPSLSSTLIAAVQPSTAADKSVTWTSSNPAVASVSATGVVTGVSVGAAVITVKTNDGGKTATCIVTVMSSMIHVTGVSLSSASLSLNAGSSSTLIATVQPSDATDKSVTWSSSNPAVASVSAAGVVTAISGGSAVITVSSNDGGKTATCAVTVASSDVRVTGVSVTPSSKSVGVGTTAVLVAAVQPDNATDKSVTWSSSNPSIASVSAGGVVTGVSVGSAVITVTTNDGGKTATCAVTVTSNAVPVKSVSLSASSRSLAVGLSVLLYANVQPDNATDKSVTWSSSNPSVASVSADGNVTAVSAGNAVITVTTNDGGKTATCAITVLVPVAVTGVTVSPASLSVKNGFTATLVATVQPADATDKSVIWSSSNPGVASVSASGLVTGMSVGTATITAKTTDGGKTATCAVTVESSVIEPVARPSAPAGYREVSLSACTISNNNPMQYLVYGANRAEGDLASPTNITAQQKTDRKRLYDTVSNLWDGDKATCYHTNFDVWNTNWSLRSGALRKLNCIIIRLPASFSRAKIWICNPVKGEIMGKVGIGGADPYHAFVDFQFSRDGTNWTLAYEAAPYSPHSDYGSQCMFDGNGAGMSIGSTFSYIKIGPHVGETSSGTFNGQQGFFGIAELAIFVQ